MIGQILAQALGGVAINKDELRERERWAQQARDYAVINSLRDEIAELKIRVEALESVKN